MEPTDLHRTMGDIVADKLRYEILAGVYRPGQEIFQDEIAQSLRVSRMPVREAVRRLEALGLVTVIPHRGTRIASLSPEDVKDIYSLRRMLEGEAVRLAAVQIRPEDLATLREMSIEMKRLAQAGETVKRTLLNKEFHSLLYAASGRRHLCNLISSLWETTAPYRSIWSSMSGHLEQSLEEHEQILAACEKQDSDLAEQIVRRHLAQTEASLLEWFAAHPEASESTGK